MRKEIYEGNTRIIIDPGEYYVSDSPVMISTLLGSCVAVCLFDPVNKVMGMNHFLVSHNRVPLVHTEAGRYGVHAMELLINDMLHLGAKRLYLKAKAFGGGNVLKGLRSGQNGMTVGEANVKFTKEFLSREGIELISESFGGESGRVVHFSYGTFSVYVRKVQGAGVGERLAMRDQNCWLYAIGQQKKIISRAKDIHLWDI
nr:chemotaxis protein CheD [uncultured Desulfuromonas sp.]